jgi:hypothetical protein
MDATAGGAFLSLNLRDATSLIEKMALLGILNVNRKRSASARIPI